MASVRTHPYIAFNYRLDHDRDIWLMLGETFSKCQHLAGVPLKPEAAIKLASVYLARGVAATTAIEGNTLSTDEVQQIVDSGSAGLPESRQYLEDEVQNVLAAVRGIDLALRRGERLPINIDRLCALNLQVLKGIPDKPEVVPGKIRQHDVAAGTYKAPPWDEVPRLLKQLVDWIAELRREVTSESRAEDRFVNAVMVAILAHVYIAWIHPFGNGNGRLARLIEVQILSESGVVPLVATNLLSDHYNKTRTLYYLALDGAQKDVTAFIRYSLKGFVDELREQIHMVRDENLKIHWESYVYEKFRGAPNTETRNRQRDLALALPGGTIVGADAATELTTSLAKKYGKQGPRTPARDLNDLVKMGLLERVRPRQYRARREVIEAFIPPTAN